MKPIKRIIFLFLAINIIAYIIIVFSNNEEVKYSGTFVREALVSGNIYQTN